MPSPVPPPACGIIERVNRIFSDRRVLAALFVFVCASAVAAESYRAILRLEGSEGPKAIEFAEGRSDYIFLAGGACVGTMGTELSPAPGAAPPEGARSLRGEGKLLVTVRGETVPSGLDFGLEFGPDGRLVAAGVGVALGQKSYRLSGAGPDPIALKLTVDSEGKAVFEKRFHLPGPVELGRSESGRYVLEYPFMRRPGNSYFRRALGSFLNDLDLRVRSQGSGARGCPPGSGGAVELSPLLFRITALSGALQVMKVIF